MGMFEDIKEFHRKFGLEYKGPSRQLPEDLQAFREGFIQEEFEEYILAIRKMECTKGVNFRKEYLSYKADALDALVDLTYVILGLAYLHGFDFEEAWRRVHEANMAKVRAEEPKQSKRESTYDVVKPEGWQAPDHSDLVAEDTWEGWDED